MRTTDESVTLVGDFAHSHAVARKGCVVVSLPNENVRNGPPTFGESFVPTMTGAFPRPRTLLRPETGRGRCVCTGRRLRRCSHKQKEALR